MREFRRKPHSARRIKDGEQRHWLGEGQLGQEALFLDLDPYLYAIDQALSHRISQVAHSRPDLRTKPLAILVPPEGTVSWQAANLAEHFEPSLWSSDEDPILVEAAAHFDVNVFVGDIPTELQGRVGIFVYTTSRWHDRQQFLMAIREAVENLADGGELIVILRCRGALANLAIEWDNGGTTPLSDVLERNVMLGLSSPIHVAHVSLGDFNPTAGEYLSAFLRRHRAFFGRNARDLCLDRMHDADFQEVFRSPHFVSMLCWRA